MKKLTWIAPATAAIATVGSSALRIDRARLFGETDAEGASSCPAVCLLSLSGLAISLVVLEFVPSAAEAFALLGGA